MDKRFTTWRILALAGALVALSAAIALLAASGARPAVTIARPAIGEPAPDFSARSLAGDVLRLNALRGGPVILNFWATWCTPCAYELPELQRLQDDFTKRGLRIVAINAGEDLTTIARWLTPLELSLDVALDPSLQIAARYQVRGQPTSFVLDAGGVLRDVIFGPASYEALAAAIDPLLPDDT